MRKKRTPLAERSLPVYTRGEEIFNMVSHIVGGGFALIAMILCIVKAVNHDSVLSVVTGTLYCLSMLLVYVISSVYHGLNPDTAGYAKRVMQVLDHCDIYSLIIGTYTPLALTGLREYNPIVAWVSWGIVVTVCIVGQVFTAIDYKKYMALSYGSYFVAGWSVLFSAYYLYQAYGLVPLLWFVGGGVVYSLGMITFCLQKNHRYCHSIFHLFIIAGSILQFIPIYLYCM